MIWIGMLIGVVIGFLSGTVYRIWANEALADENRKLERELHSWRSGWVPRGWYNDRIAKSRGDFVCEVAKELSSRLESKRS